MVSRPFGSLAGACSEDFSNVNNVQSCSSSGIIMMTMIKTTKPCLVKEG